MIKPNLKTWTGPLTFHKIKTPTTEVLGYKTRVYQSYYHFVEPKKGEPGNQYFDIREIQDEQKKEVDTPDENPEDDEMLAALMESYNRAIMDPDIDTEKINQIEKDIKKRCRKLNIGYPELPLLE